MNETPDDLERLQALLDRSMATAGPHLAGIITPERQLDAATLVARLQGMILLTAASVTADGRPLAGPVDGYFLHGELHFSSGRDAVRIGHLRTRPGVSAVYLPGENLALSVHGRAHLYEVNDPSRPELRRAMLDHYLPWQGPSFQEWLEGSDAVAARIEADKMFTFSLED